MRPATLLKYRRLCRLVIRLIVPGLHHLLYLNKLVNSSLSRDVFQVTLMELGRMTMAIFIRFYLQMTIMKNCVKKNMIRMLPTHTYPSATSD